MLKQSVRVMFLPKDQPHNNGKSVMLDMLMAGLGL